tara:strand:- start:274 stop:1497 length:1224 start_codon:yes stop_codon:yes gene_type:complete
MTIAKIVEGETVGVMVNNKLNPVIGAVNGMLIGAFNPLDNHSTRDEDNSIATVQTATTDAALTKITTIWDNLDIFHTNGYVELFDYSGSKRFGQASSLPTGNVNADYNQVCACVSFKFDGDMVSIQCLTGSVTGIYSISVDGTFIDKSGYVNVGAGFQGIQLDFGTAKPSGRVIRVYTAATAAAILRVNTKPEHTCTNPNLSTKRVAFVADSFGAFDDDPAQGWIPSIADAFSWHNFLPNATGGTGFVNNQGGAKYNYIERIADIVTFDAEKLIVSCSINDSGYSAAVIQQAVEDYLAAVYTQLPNIEDVIILGPPGAYTTSNETNELAALAAVNAFNTANSKNVKFIRSQTQQPGGLVYGTGWVGSETGDGNADIYKVDEYHYNGNGHRYWVPPMIAEMVRQGVTY